MKKFLASLAFVTALALVYALVPKTTVFHFSTTETQPYTLTYTGFGIRGSGFLGFKPQSIVCSGSSGYDAGTTTVTITPISGGWAFCERGERGQMRAYGFVAGSASIERGILAPDLKHHLDASYFYSPDGSTTGFVREGSGAYDIVTPKFIHHVKVSDGATVISKSPSA